MQAEKEIIPAKMCYAHIGGKLGEKLKDWFVDKKWIVKARAADKHYYVTEKGLKELTQLGLDLSEIKKEPFITD